MPIQPLVQIPISPAIASLPKADLHVHQEEIARPERIVARHQGRPAHDWRAAARQLLTETLPGRNRIGDIYAPDAGLGLGWTTIGREYALAAALGFSPTELLAFTRHAIQASFASTERRRMLLDQTSQWKAL